MKLGLWEWPPDGWQGKGTEACERAPQYVCAAARRVGGAAAAHEEGCVASAWEAWRSDPATGMYGPAEVQLIVDLAYIYELWVMEPTAALAAELRQRQDGLGLSPKGKQDRRWRVVAEVEAQEAAATRVVPSARRLRAV